jgi:hypothetical protein
LKDRERTLGDFVFFQFTDLGFVQFGPWDVGVLTVAAASAVASQHSLQYWE